MRRVIAFIIAAVLPVCTTAEPLRVGAILPLSGPGAEWGLHLKRGAEIASGSNPGVQLSIEDDHLDAAAAVPAFNKLRDIDAIDAVLVFGAQSARAVVPLAERAGIISLIITADPGPAADSKYGIRLVLDAPPQAAALIEIMKKRGIKSAALVGTTQEAMIEYLRTFEEQAARSGISSVFHEEYGKGEIDFRTQIERIIARKPEAIVISLLPPSFSAFAKQYRSRAPTGAPLFGFAQAENRSEIAAAQGTLDGLVFPQVSVSPEFTARFRERYGEEPQSYAAYSHDLISIFAQAGRGSSSREEIARKLRSIRNFPGACGQLSANSSNSFDLSPRVMTIRADSLLPLADGD